MNTDAPAYGPWSLVLINAAIFVLSGWLASRYPGIDLLSHNSATFCRRLWVGRAICTSAPCTGSATYSSASLTIHLESSRNDIGISRRDSDGTQLPHDRSSCAHPACRLDSGLWPGYRIGGDLRLQRPAEHRRVLRPVRPLHGQPFVHARRAWRSRRSWATPPLDNECGWPDERGSIQ